MALIWYLGTVFRNYGDEFSHRVIESGSRRECTVAEWSCSTQLGGSVALWPKYVTVFSKRWT